MEDGRRPIEFPTHPVVVEEATALSTARDRLVATLVGPFIRLLQENPGIPSVIKDQIPGNARALVDPVYQSHVSTVASYQIAVLSAALSITIHDPVPRSTMLGQIRMFDSAAFLDSSAIHHQPLGDRLPATFTHRTVRQGSENTPIDHYLLSAFYNGRIALQHSVFRNGAAPEIKTVAAFHYFVINGITVEVAINLERTFLRAYYPGAVIPSQPQDKLLLPYIGYDVQSMRVVRGAVERTSEMTFLTETAIYPNGEEGSKIISVFQAPNSEPLRAPVGEMRVTSRYNGGYTCELHTGDSQSKSYSRLHVDELPGHEALYTLLRDNERCTGSSVTIEGRRRIYTYTGDASGTDEQIQITAKTSNTPSPKVHEVKVNGRRKKVVAVEFQAADQLLCFVDIDETTQLIFNLALGPIDDVAIQPKHRH